MYGKQRFLVNNLITSDTMITASSQAAGRISGVTTQATGTAVWGATGSYTGARDILVTVYIDSVTAGKEIGQATFSWKTSETTTGWEATGVTTSATAVSLGTDGKKVIWTTATGNDFEEGDTGTFWCYAPFGPAAMLDLDRNTYWQATGDTSETLVIDLGSAQLVTAFFLMDTNLTSGATITLQGNASNVWTSPTYSQVVTTQDPASLYLSQTFQYWRIVVADASNPDGYIQIAEIYLGTYTELVADYARLQWGSDMRRVRRLVENEAETGRRTQRIWSIQRSFDAVYGVLDPTDQATLQAIWTGLHNTITGTVKPLYVHYFYDEADTLMLCRMMSDYDQTFSRYNFNKISLRLEEVAKTR